MVGGALTSLQPLLSEHSEDSNEYDVGMFLLRKGPKRMLAVEAFCGERSLSQEELGLVEAEDGLVSISR
jgi:hypothetical protein